MTAAAAPVLPLFARHPWLSFGLGIASCAAAMTVLNRSLGQEAAAHRVLMQRKALMDKHLHDEISMEMQLGRGVHKRCTCAVCKAPSAPSVPPPSATALTPEQVAAVKEYRPTPVQSLLYSAVGWWWTASPPAEK